jgi:serine/threonine protein kinase
VADLTGQVLDDKYLIERPLGKGGMGTVYLATHLGTDRPVAVKVIVPQFMRQDEFVERFRREAKAAGRLRHPNVVDVTDFGFATVASERVAYLVMEYLDGCSLAEILAEESRLSINWVVDILEQACSAIEEAHREGIVHRDLKPDNIWLEPNRRGGYTVKVLDFGLAKVVEPSVPAATAPSSPDDRSSERTLIVPAAPTAPLSEQPSEAVTRLMSVEEQETRILAPDSSEAVTHLQLSVEDTPAHDGRTTAGAALDGLTRVGSILGTPLYMSPEQCRGEPLDARSDIYSLGVIAYQMLAGETPFKGDADTVIRHHIETAPPPLRQKRRKVPKKMASLVMSALAKNPADRPASAEGLATALHAYADGTAMLLRRAFALYSEHFPRFIGVSLLLYLPLIAIAAIQLAGYTLSRGGVISTPAYRVTDVLLTVLYGLGSFLVAAGINGITIRLVTQLFVAPQRPLKVRLAYAALKKRLLALLGTTLLVGLVSAVGFVLLVIPGLIFTINYSLSVPVVMMERLKGWAAMKRSKALVKRARFTVIVTLFIQWAIPSLVSGPIAAVVTLALKALRVADAPQLTGKLVGLATALLTAFLVPLMSIMTALLYLKTRRAGGETLRETLSEFEEEEAPRSNWQLRMRERLTIPALQSGRATQQQERTLE